MSANAAVAPVIEPKYRAVATQFGHVQKKGAIAMLYADAVVQVLDSDKASTEISFGSLRGVKRVVSREDKDNTWLTVAFIIALLCLIIIGILL